MRRILFPFRVLLAMFRLAGPPEWPTLAQSGAVLATWLVLFRLAPGLAGGAAFASTVFVAIASGQAVRLGTTLKRIRTARVPGAGPVVLGAVAAIYGLIFLAPDPVWLQRLMTVLPALFAIACLIDILDGEGTFAAHWWPDPELREARPALTRAFLLKHTGFALLNETLIAAVSPQAWLLYLAVLPVLHHFVTSALTASVLLERDRAE